jgi:transcriptional regulator with XRE-family HTH domain
MTTRYEHFGRIVRIARQKRGWSQEVLADRADLNRSYLGEIERGDVVPSLNSMAKLSLALATPLSELISRCEADLHT